MVNDSTQKGWHSSAHSGDRASVDMRTARSARSASTAARAAACSAAGAAASLVFAALHFAGTAGGLAGLAAGTLGGLARVATLLASGAAGAAPSLLALASRRDTRDRSRGWPLGRTGGFRTPGRSLGRPASGFGTTRRGLRAANRLGTASRLGTANGLGSANGLRATDGLRPPDGLRAASRGSASRRRPVRRPRGRPRRRRRRARGRRRRRRRVVNFERLAEVNVHHGLRRVRRADLDRARRGRGGVDLDHGLHLAGWQHVDHGRRAGVHDGHGGLHDDDDGLALLGELLDVGILCTSLGQQPLDGRRVLCALLRRHCLRARRRKARGKH
jgi:hypothetical protein